MIAWLKWLAEIWGLYWAGKRSQRIDDDEQSLLDAEVARRIETKIDELGDAELDRQLRKYSRPET